MLTLRGSCGEFLVIVRAEINSCRDSIWRVVYKMKSTRMEAFSDGVLAIAITVMVLEMKVPHGTDRNARRLACTFRCSRLLPS